MISVCPDMGHPSTPLDSQTIDVGWAPPRFSSWQVCSHGETYPVIPAAEIFWSSPGILSKFETIFSLSPIILRGRQGSSTGRGSSFRGILVKYQWGVLASHLSQVLVQGFFPLWLRMVECPVALDLWAKVALSFFPVSCFFLFISSEALNCVLFKILPRLVRPSLVSLCHLP